MSKAHKHAAAYSRARSREPRRRETQFQEKAVRREVVQIARRVRTKPV